MVSDPAITTRSPSLMIMSNGISSFSAPRSSDYEGDAAWSELQLMGEKMFDTYEIIEQVLVFGPFLLPRNSLFEAGFSHVVQVI